MRMTKTPEIPKELLAETEIEEFEILKEWNYPELVAVQSLIENYFSI